ncbi:unnamed protein product [Lactuca saligna]|uniref:Disease resistance protein At4g27190-like leucine-rich repeats domain-containing protein n=1 Tax=Lactuca saligna TaxID=75948 RepID=A0AA35V5P6_LACSI|nr:unnamed protein product [Lactuca saligna]
METNNITNLEIRGRARVTGWLKDVEKIKEDAQIISSTGNNHFKVTNGDFSSIINHGDISNWSRAEMRVLPNNLYYLHSLPKLASLCNTANVIELPKLVELILDGLPDFSSIYPEKTSVTSSMSNNISAIQPIFNNEMLIPNLKILLIVRMNKLKEIWPYQFSRSDEVDTCIFRKIEVKKHNNLVNLFPINHMYFLGRLEELHVSYCGSFEMLFNIEMSCVGEIEKHSSNLRCIHVYKLGKRELWRMKGPPTYVDPLNITAMACPAHPLCPLAITEAERGIPDLLKRVRAVFEKVGLPYNESIVVRVTGCPNGCARPYMAELGLVGDARTFMNKVKIQDLEKVFEPLFHSWKSKRKSKESFSDFTNCVGFEKLQEIVDKWEAVDALARIENKSAHQLAIEVCNAPILRKKVFGKEELGGQETRSKEGVGIRNLPQLASFGGGGVFGSDPRVGVHQPSRHLQGTSGDHGKRRRDRTAPHPYDQAFGTL